jgi:transposase-like protein
MKASEASRNHTRADLVLLHQLWAEGVASSEIAKRFGVAYSTVTKWAQRYKLPRRTLHPADEPEAPTPEDDAASLDGLALSPWVEERASDIVERLRNWRNVHLARLHLLMEEAADEMERLRLTADELSRTGSDVAKTGDDSQE